MSRSCCQHTTQRSTSSCATIGISPFLLKRTEAPMQEKLLTAHTHLPTTEYTECFRWKLILTTQQLLMNTSIWAKPCLWHVLHITRIQAASMLSISIT